MPMIDVYAPADLFPANADRELGGAPPRAARGQEVVGGTAPPLTAHIQLKETSSLPAVWHNESAFTILRLQSGAGLQEPITHVSGIPALLVSISIKPLESELYRLWIADKLMPTPFIPPFRATVIDCDAQPRCWAGSEFAYVPYPVPTETMND